VEASEKKRKEKEGMSQKPEFHGELLKGGGGRSLYNGGQMIAHLARGTGARRDSGCCFRSGGRKRGFRGDEANELYRREVARSVLSR